MNKIVKTIIQFSIAFVISIGLGIAGAVGGAGILLWRRAFIPSVLSIFAICMFMPEYGGLALWCLTLMSLWGNYSIGYGLPSWDDDKPSALGSFWYTYFINKQSHDDVIYLGTSTVELKANIAVRSTLGFMKCFCVLVIPILTHAWLVWAVCSLVMCLNTLLWGAIVKNEGMYRLFGRDLLWEETFIYLGDAMCITTMILLSILPG